MIMFLENTLQYALEWGDCWHATLGEIAKWWREKQGFSFSIRSLTSDRWQIRTQCSERATVMATGAHQRIKHGLDDHGEILPTDGYVITSPVKPMICIAPDASKEVEQFLRTEGFAFERSIHPKHYSLQIREAGPMNSETKMRLLSTIMANPYPCLRFWRWPYGLRFCFAVSGDIDGVDFWDFLERFYG